MTSLFTPGAGGDGPSGPVREPLHPDERDGRRYDALPPSERGRAEQDHRGVGVFRVASWGWILTIGLALLVATVVLIGWLRGDPSRNPAPAAYRSAVCAAAVELAAGTDALERGVEGRSDPATRAEAADEVEARVAAANDALTGLPEWAPGRTLDELLGSQIITLTNGATSLDAGPAAEDLEIARAVDADMRAQLADGRHGFSCDI